MSLAEDMPLADHLVQGSARRRPSPPRTRRPGATIPQIAPNGPATDGGRTPDLGATVDGLGWSQALLFDANPVAMWVYDVETLRFLAVNEATVRQYGWSRHELLSMTVLDLLAPEDRPALLKELLAGTPAGRSGDAPAQRWHHTRGGAVRRVEVQAEPVTFGGRRGFLTLARDVTERDELRAILDTTGDQFQREAAEALSQPALPRVRTQARNQTAEELRVAVDSDQLRVVYQPIVHLGQVTPAGVEALVRWQHPRRGLLAPAEFIQVAEDTGLIVPLGEWVLRQACRDLTGILAGAGGASELVVSVNLSARQLSTPGLVPRVESVLNEFGLDPWRLCFEITESILMEDVALATSVLSDLRALGVRLAIDDFGTGYSSLGYLRRFPVDIVKLDRAFVAGLGTDSAADAITAAVINLGHALGLSVIAEGVETEEQLTILRALRCDRAQGYLWSPPQTPEALAHWLAAKPSGRLELGPVNLSTLFAEQVATIRSVSRAPVVVRAPSTLADAFADAGAVRKVLDHLLGNALKYSPGDRPVVVSAAADKRFVRISVADHGIGMTADEVARCFEPFWQADHPGGQELGGAGVGLYIVRSLAEAMGGHVAVRSAKGAGSTFTVALPRAAPEAQRAGPDGALPPGVGEESSIREFGRQMGGPPGGRVRPLSVPGRRGTGKKR